MPIPLRGVYGGSSPLDVIRYDGGYLAVGGVNGGCCDGGFSEETRAVVWRSRDGATWRLVADAPAFRYGRMWSVASLGSQLVAIGNRHLDGIGRVAAAWVSSDGETWKLVRDVPLFADIVASRSGFVAVTAGTDEDPGASLWTSTTGETWKRMSGAEVGGDELTGFVEVGGDDFLVGSNVLDQHGGTAMTGAIWRSNNGLDWDRVPDQAALAGLSIGDVAKVGSTYFALGTNVESEQTLLLTSGDGTTWSRNDLPPFDRSLFGSGLVATAAGLLVLGSITNAEGESAFHAWTSVDGVHWALVMSREGTTGVEIAGWVEVAGGVLAVATGARATETRGPIAWRIR
jgi:hypothetical protein